MSFHDATTPIDSARHQARMDRKYRHGRHIFDLTRKFFLFGRERAIANLAPPAGTILEIGVGTARNLVMIAKAMPAAKLIGLDISTEMLKSAAGKIRRYGLQDHVTLLQGDAADAAALAAIGGPVPRILMSYSLSMVPDWRRALSTAIGALQPGGILSIVDFGDFRGWPSRTRQFCIDMLSAHDAPPCLDLERTLAFHAAFDSVSYRHVFGLGGFYQIAVVMRHAAE